MDGTTTAPDGPGRSDPTLTVLYDADCGVCRLTVRALGRLDWRHRLRMTPLQAFVGDGPSRHQLASTLHAIGADGRWATGGDATLAIAAELPALVPFAILGRLPGARRLVGATYEAVAANRGTISRVLRLDSCAPQLRARTGA